MHRFQSARIAYSRGLSECELTTATNVDLLSNRSNAWFQLGEWSLALADADAVLRVDARHKKAAFRRARSLVRLERYAEALKAWQFVQSLLYDDATNDNGDSSAATSADTDRVECLRAITQAKAALLQSAGEFDWPEIVRQLKNNSDLDCASYLRANVVPRSAQDRGRGMVVLNEPLSAGTLILVESPLAMTTNTHKNKIKNKKT